MIPSYSSIYNLGHKAVTDLLLDPVLVQEKIDGSQISFGIFQDSDNDFVLHVRSKGVALNIIAPDKMFGPGVEVIKSIKHKLIPGYVYRGEYLAKPKHNSLAYDRTPRNLIALFDVETSRGSQDFVPIKTLEDIALELELDFAPTLFYGNVETYDMFRALLDTASFLGGQKIEGVVIKNYARFGPDKRPLMAKFVSEAFKEVHAIEWKKSNPTTTDILQSIIQAYNTPTRWAKSVQHLREAGEITDSPRDIGLLMVEVKEDIKRECYDEIVEKLANYFWPKISRAIGSGLPEWYKEQLARLQFERE